VGVGSRPSLRSERATTLWHYFLYARSNIVIYSDCSQA
jgi:hypothetical protein